MIIVKVAHRVVWVTFVLSTLVSARQAAAQAADPDPHRFDEEIQAFAVWDAKNATPRDPVVFVGSSSIRFWNTGERFPNLPVVNRGFGGAHISDVNAFVDETVLRYKPQVVVFYAGDNDIGAGKSDDQVVEDYLEFVDVVHAANPSVDIVFIPIKPSLARWSMWAQMSAANERVRRYSEDHENLHYVDLASPILGTDGHPRPEFFVDDGLHLTAAGYDAWTAVLADFLRSLR